MKQKLTIVKIGGNVIDNPEALDTFLVDFSQLKGPKVLVHGGGKLASQKLKQMGIEPKMVDGRRITDEQTLEVIVMVYGGLINKNIVAQLQQLGNNALGLSGADMNSILAHKRPVKEIDYGFAGDVDTVETENLDLLINNSVVPVFCPLTHDKKGQLLNTNADTIASQLAIGLSRSWSVDLVYCFEIKGVMKDMDKGIIFEEMNPATYEEARTTGLLTGGILPKLDNAFESLNQGVENVVICQADALKNWSGSNFEGTVLHL